MKRVMECMLAGGAILGLLGCSSKGNPEEVLKNAEEKGYKIAVSYSAEEDFYDFDGTYLNDDFEATTCERILTDLDADLPQLFLKKNNDQIVFHSSDGNFGVSAYFSKANYTILKGDESIHLMDGSYDTWCTYYYHGGDDDDRKCDETRKGDADKIKEKFDTMIKDIDLSRDDFESFFNWVQENKITGLHDSLKTKQAEQKKLTTNEIKQLLEKDFTIDHDSKGNVRLTKSKDLPVIFTQMDNGIMMYDDLFSSDSSKYKMTIAYIYDTDSYISLDRNSVCGYDVTNEKVLDGKTCNEDQISTAKSLKGLFESHVLTSHISMDEFVSFMKSY